MSSVNGAMQLVKMGAVVGGTAAISLASYFSGASLASKFISKEKTSTEVSLALLGGGAVVGNIAAKMIREYARQNCSPAVLRASCLGTFLGSILPMVTCIGGYNQKETSTTKMIATMSLVSTLVLNLAALINPQDESVMKFAGSILFAAMPV